MLLVGSTQYFALVWPCGAHQPFIVHTGNDVLKLSVAIFISHFRIKWLKARRQNDRPDFDLYLLRPLIEIDGLILTDSFANTTFLFFQIDTAFIDIRDQGNRLGEINVDGLIFRYFLIKLIRVFDWAIFYAGRTTCAFAL